MSRIWEEGLVQKPNASNVHRSYGENPLKVKIHWASSIEKRKHTASIHHIQKRKQRKETRQEASKLMSADCTSQFCPIYLKLYYQNIKNTPTFYLPRWDNTDRQTLFSIITNLINTSQYKQCICFCKLLQTKNSNWSLS